MKIKIFQKIVIMCTALGFALASPAEMQSTNYLIETSVHSGAGSPMNSASYQTNSTVGQSSPTTENGLYPFSDNYDGYPGFWHTVFALTQICIGDIDGDGDIDGSDLAAFITKDAGIGLNDFAAKFGITQCP